MNSKRIGIIIIIISMLFTPACTSNKIIKPVTKAYLLNAEYPSYYLLKKQFIRDNKPPNAGIVWIE